MISSNYIFYCCLVQLSLTKYMNPLFCGGIPMAPLLPQGQLLNQSGAPMTP